MNYLVRNVDEVPVEEAHGGSGSRKMIYSGGDGVASDNLEAFVNGFLPANGVFDWHDHETDEFFIVLDGTGEIWYREDDGSETKLDYQKGSTAYHQRKVMHKIVNTGAETSEFIFVRITHA